MPRRPCLLRPAVEGACDATDWGRGAVRVDALRRIMADQRCAVDDSSHLVAVATLVAEYLRAETPDAAYALDFVLAALAGETEPARLGVDVGSDTAGKIRAIRDGVPR